MSEYIVGNDGDESILDIGEFELRFQERERIVRCRDCEYAVDNDWFGYLQCNRPPDGDGGCLRVPTEPDGFCKWGERRNESLVEFIEREGRKRDTNAEEE